MKVTIDDIVKYTFCPNFFRLNGEISTTSSSLHSKLQELVLYTLRREFELETKTTWKQVLDKWIRLFWLDTEDSPASQTLFNKSQIGIKKFFNWYIELPLTPLALKFNLNGTIGNHQVISEVPFILQKEDGTVACVFMESAGSVDDALRSHRIVCTSHLMNSEIAVSQIFNISFTSKNTFSVVSVFPTERFWDRAHSELYGVLTSMQNDFYYMNSSSCGGCILRKECSDMLA